jgi:DNA (cytosine-5)-methyltransferase 1
MKYISLFAGVGGFDLALNKLGHECVYANDFDKYCKIIYDKNFKHKLDCRSLTEVRADELPDFDLLVGGFPCQSFSIAGKRGGFDDTRGTLFFDIARIVKAKRPKYLLLENVKGLLSHDSGRTFKTILSTLTELHYDIQTMVLNSKNFGVPQNRERVFIVGHLRGEPRPKVFPLTGSNEQDKEQITSTALDANYWKGVDDHGQRTMVGTWRTHIDGQGFREVKSGLSPTIPARAREDGSGQPVIMKDMRIRRLTPTECERLQGFPDNWTAGVSDTQRYKMMGNAVTTNVVFEVARRLI